MKGVATGSFTQSIPSEVTDIPDHLTMLCEHKPVTPDPYCGRFRLRSNQLIQPSKEPKLHELEARWSWGTT